VNRTLPFDKPDHLRHCVLAVQATAAGAKVKESDFYQPFADWLRNDLDEVTEVASLGGAGLKSKWGTPDVVGIYKPLV